MKKGICYIVGAGENAGLPFTPLPEDYVIAADGGLCFLEREGIAAHMVIGDFDSLPEVPGHPNVVTLPKEKDDTDMRAAVLEGIHRGYELFHIYCGCGGRIEHTIANIQILAELSQNGRRGYLFAKDNIITAVTDGAICFGSRASGYVSVFAHSEKASGVSIKGLKYELDGAVLVNTYPLGVSNEFIGKEGRISVESGTLLVVFPVGTEVEAEKQEGISK